MNMAKFYFSGGEPKLDNTYENGLNKRKIGLYSVSYCFKGNQMENHSPEKIGMMCEWILIPALEHPLQQLIHSVFGLPPAPPYVNAKFPWERITSDTTLTTRLKSKQVVHRKKKQIWTIKKGKKALSRAFPLLCSIRKTLQQIRKLIVKLLFVFTNHFIWLFFVFKNVLILWTSFNQFCNQSSIRLEKSWISFNYP